MDEDGLVTFGATAILFFAGLGPAPAADDFAPVQFAELTVRRQIVVRSIRILPAPTNASAKIDWKEIKGPQCLQARSIAGASLLGQRSVDLVLRNGARVRARLGANCPALDYYTGFYITPGADGRVCADRETIRARAGGHCEINSFRVLRAVPKRLTSDTP